MKHRPLHEKFFLTRIFCFLFWILVLFLPHRNVLALGLYSPTIALGEVEAGEDYTGTFRVVREAGEVGTGSLSVDVEITGDQWISVTGEESFVMSASENAYDYTFLFSPNAVQTGDYQIHFIFFLEPSGSHDGGAGAVVREGVEGTLTYRMITSSETGTGSVSSGQGTSSSSGTETSSGSSDSETEDEGTSSQEGGTEEEDDTQISDSPEQIEVSERSESETETIWTGDGTEGSRESTDAGDAVATESSATSEADSVDFQDVAEFMGFYGQTGSGLSSHDLDGGGSIGLSDLSLLVSQWTSDEGGFTGLSPVEPGEPLDEDVILFKFQVAHADREKFSVILSSAHKTTDDEVTMYILVDTGQGGVNTADLTIDYDTEKLRFIDAEIEGSIFSIFRSKPQEIESGKISLTAATPWSFVGTNGFVATLYFSLIAKGEAALRFEEIESYGEDAYEPGQVLGTDLIGIVDKKSTSLSDTTEEEVRAEQIPSYFFQINFLEIILLLILLMDTIAFWILYRDTKDQQYV
ncbi:TPA: hypothetical protein DEP34_00160 [Candidatus Uhrbacteria bacterium]|nr:hypothetical protein [Candidatus Uhrbacteria bacterium]HCB18786.1 hypothetical protein [Candidatus Uhrbacteria bacterium]